VKRILTTPVKTGDIEDLRTGDIVYLTGLLVTGRDDVHHRVVHEGLKCPVDFTGIGLMHAGPIIREESGGNSLVSIGPTSSIRMEDDESEFMRLTGVKIIVGKGGMGPKTSAGCKKYGVIHTVFPGGCAVSACGHVEKIEDVFWRELGMPECLWVMRVKEFGPLFVSIDTLGNNMFMENKAWYASRKADCMAPIIESVKDYMKVEIQ
jgi:L(+)-tartrate dehydratase beta subunit